LSRQATNRLGDGIADGFGAVTGKGWSIPNWFCCPMALHSWQVQEHGEASCAFDQCTDRRAAKTKNEVALPPLGTLLRNALPGSEWPGTALSLISAGRSLIVNASVRKDLQRLRPRSRGNLSARPDRRHAESSRFSAPRPWM